jgi:serine O-acetyltransferase
MPRLVCHQAWSDPVFENLRADLQAARRHNASSGSWIDQNITIWLHYGTQSVAVYRFGRWVKGLRIPLLKHLLFIVYIIARTWCETIYGVAIADSTVIGPGFCVHTWGGLFTPHNQRIGKNFTVNTGNLIEDGVTIGDDVYVGVGAKAIGQIRIGNNVTIGANALVRTDVPDNSVAVGVPARILPKREHRSAPLP